MASEKDSWHCVILCVSVSLGALNMCEFMFAPVADDQCIAPQADFVSTCRDSSAALSGGKTMPTQPIREPILDVVNSCIFTHGVMEQLSFIFESCVCPPAEYRSNIHFLFVLFLVSTNSCGRYQAL